MPKHPTEISQFNWLDQLRSLCALLSSPSSPNLAGKEDVKHARMKIPSRCSDAGSHFPLHRLSPSLTRCTRGERVCMYAQVTSLPPEDFTPWKANNDKDKLGRIRLKLSTRSA